MCISGPRTYDHVVRLNSTERFCVCTNCGNTDYAHAGTDGLWDNVYEAEILQLLPSTSEGVSTAADAIATLARRHASDDEFASPYTKEALLQGCVMRKRTVQLVCELTKIH